MQPVSKHLPIFPKSQIVSDKYVSHFMARYTEVLNDMTEFDSLSLIPSVGTRLKDILNYNVVGINYISSHLLLYCSKYLREHYCILKPEEMEKSYKLAWCLEIMIISSLMMDDMLEGAKFRNKRKTWYTLKGPQAICDIYLLQSCCLKLLEQYFSDHKNYTRIFGIFIGSGLKAAVGETFQHEHKNLKSFTMENFETIASLKTAVPGFIAPFQLACLLFQRDDFVEDENCINLMKELGICSQMQNDYWDCFGETILGKRGNDIQENVCTMLIAVALQKADAEQKNILSENYGHYDPKRVERVKKVYEDLELEESFHELFEQRQKNIHSILLKMEDDSKRCLMQNISNKIYSIMSRKS